LESARNLVEGGYNSVPGGNSISSLNRTNTRKTKLEIKSITLKAMQYRLDLMQSGLNYYLNSQHKKYLAPTQRPIFLRFGKFPPQICEPDDATY